MQLPNWRGLLLLLLITRLIMVPAQAEPNGPIHLLASIKPLALIAQEVGGDNVQIDTLLPYTASPHDYPLKMSDHRRLRQADLVLWVGPELESFLAKPLTNLDPDKVLSSYDLAGIVWPQHREAEPDEHHHAQDPHLWLNPQNAVVVAYALARKLAQLQPQNAQAFNARADDFSRRMTELDKQLKAQLAPVRERGFAVYHEGYGHFVEHYGLRQLAYITFTPERRPGAKHLDELQQVLKQKGVCLFSEPYQKTDYVQAMAQDLGLRLGQLDPIGNHQVTHYEDLLNNMSQAFLTCLADRADH